MLKIGVTGSRIRAVGDQFFAMAELFEQNADSVVEFHNGGCVGVDRQCFVLGHAFTDSALSHVWPGMVDPSLQFEIPDWKNVVVHEPMPPLVRNLEIIAHSDWIWAFPSSMKEKVRSGTWHTIRHTREAELPLTIVYPDGSVNNSWEET